MDRVRHRVRFGAWSALFALAVQLAALFGHVHPLKLGLSDRLVAAAAGVLAVQSGSGTPATPASDDCDICIVASHAGSALVGSPPELPVPTVSRLIRFRPEAEHADAAQPLHAFRARAPPRSAV